MYLYLLPIIPLCFLLKFLSKTSLLQILKKWLTLLIDKCYVYQYYKIPQYNHNLQENELYRKVNTYLNSFHVEDFDYTNLFTGNKSNEVNVVLDENQNIVDYFFSARVYWIKEMDQVTGLKSFVLKVRKNDKRRILRPYIQHIHEKFEEIEERKKEVRLFVNVKNKFVNNRVWMSVQWSHPATFDTVIMEQDLKNKVKSDLESFLKGKSYYQRIGKAWKRNYLLYGPSGTGKSTFIAAMANYLRYDVYEINLSKLYDSLDLKQLLLQTTNKSLIVIEDLDRYLCDKSTAMSLSEMLNFMDGLCSFCGDERVMIFTMNNKDEIDPTVLRPGRIDFQIHFPLCDFNGFKSLASSHLNLKDHKLFPQVEEKLQAGSVLSPAEISEIMISNRSSPTRALKMVISAHQSNTEVSRPGIPNKNGMVKSSSEAMLASAQPQWLTKSKSVRPVEESGESGKFPLGLRKSRSVRPVEESGESGAFGKESVNELRKFYGLIRVRSSRKKSFDLDTLEKENSRHGS